ncbi:MAG: hypothetical protein ACTSXC_04720 [Candidatus Freyarchaeota archaeon]
MAVKSPFMEAERFVKSLWRNLPELPVLGKPPEPPSIFGPRKVETRTETKTEAEPIRIEEVPVTEIEAKAKEKEKTKPRRGYPSWWRRGYDEVEPPRTYDKRRVYGERE